MYNGIIHGGSTLTNSATGTIEAFAGSNTLGGTITNPAGGVVKIDNAAVLNLENGSYPNLGSVQLNSTGANTVLEVAGANVTLSGGSVTMSNNAGNYILGALGTDTLTNQETIQGAGTIGNGSLTLVNSGTINANQSAGLTIQGFARLRQGPLHIMRIVPTGIRHHRTTSPANRRRPLMSQPARRAISASASNGTQTGPPQGTGRRK